MIAFDAGKGQCEEWGSRLDQGVFDAVALSVDPVVFPSKNPQVRLRRTGEVDITNLPTRWCTQLYSNSNSSTRSPAQPHNTPDTYAFAVPRPDWKEQRGHATALSWKRRGSSWESGMHQSGTVCARGKACAAGTLTPQTTRKGAV